MNFNLNHYVKFKLTDRGRSLHKIDHESFWAQVGIQHPYLPLQEDAEGYVHMQMWCLMQAFGKYMGNGFELVIETDIMVPEWGDGSRPFHYRPLPPLISKGPDTCPHYYSETTIVGHGPGLICQFCGELRGESNAPV